MGVRPNRKRVYVMEVSYLHKTEPYHHQADCFYFCYDKPFFAEFMEQGTGKSKVLIDVVSNLFVERKLSCVLLIAPNGVHTQWADEQVPMHSPIPYSTFVFDASKFKGKEIQREWKAFIKPAPQIRWLFVNVDSFSYPTYLNDFRQFVLSGPCLVAVDESTTIKTPDAARTINVIQGLSEVTKIRNTVTRSVPLSKYRAILTGTPTTNSPYDLYSMVDFLSHNWFGLTYGAFRARYGLEKLDKVPGSQRYDQKGNVVPGSGKQFRKRISLKEMGEIRSAAANGGKLSVIATYMGLNVLDVEFIVKHPGLTVPYKNLPELKAKIAPFAFFALKKDCLDLPAKTYEKRVVKLSPEQKEVYDNLKAEMYAEYAGKELTALTKIALMTRLSQVVGGVFPYTDTVADAEDVEYVPNAPKYVRIGKSWPKLDALIQALNETTPPVIVTARFTAEIDIIYDAILSRTEYSVFKSHGLVPRMERNEGIQAFKDGRVDVLLGSIGTISRGHNLQIASDMLIYSNSYSSESREQLEDRIHRIGMGDHALYTDFVTLGTVDTRILDALRLKKDLLDYMRGDSIEEFLA
jgi:SNF2 family DNA or RNA helicase